MTQEGALHIEHYKLEDVGGIGRENQRTASEYKNAVNHSKSSGNYLASSGGPVQQFSYTDAIKSALLRLGCRYEKRRARGGRGGRPRKVLVYDDGKAIRSDANVMTSIVVTVSRENADAWGLPLVRAYFKAASDYFSAQYGNKLDDPVHVDEDNAGYHLHYNFIPWVNGRINSNALFNKKTMARIHTDFARHMKGLGFDVVRGIEGGKKQYERTLAALRKKQARLAALSAADETALEDICKRAEKLAASRSFLGFGSDKPMRIAFNLEDANRLVKLAEAGASAAETLAQYKAREDLARSTFERAAALRQKVEELEKQLEEMQAQLIRASLEAQEKLQAARKEATREAVKAYAKKYDRLLHNGRFLERLLPYKDLVDAVEELHKQAVARDNARSNSPRRSSRSRDDDYSR